MSEFLPEMPIRVLVAAKLPHQDGALTYRAGGAMRAGELVSVPLGKRQVVGMVLGADEKDIGKKMRLKTAEAYAESYTLPPSMLPFINWVAGWYMEAPGGVFKMAVSVPSALKPEKAPTDDVLAVSALPPRREPLTEAQNAAATPLVARINKGFSVSVLDGVTGSGKTEIYFEAIAAAPQKWQAGVDFTPRNCPIKEF